MDNARIHHSKIYMKYMENSKHKILFNVPYCPEYNPIEMVFSKLKSIIRRKDNSTIVRLIKNINYSFKQISKTDLNNFYSKSLII